MSPWGKEAKLDGRLLILRDFQDPDIMAILQDPVMQSILQQAKGDPAALQDHMKNPGIASKIQKLIAAGEYSHHPVL